MFDITQEGLITFALAFAPALFGIICHEIAHGYAAYKLGDPTAKALGRLTLNPVSHLDPMGTMVFAVTALFNTGFIFGWAKPVPIDWRFFKAPRRDMIITSFAGPLANIAVAVFFGILLKSLITFSGPVAPNSAAMYLADAFSYGLTINCSLAIFNLLPVPPLDGSHILAGLLPRSLAAGYEKLGLFGIVIVVMLAASGLFSVVLGPVRRLLINAVASLVGLQ